MIQASLTANAEGTEAAALEARQPRLSPERMYAAVLAGDPQYDGRFFTGVLTTGIYCLPSCKARKPKCNNVRFFPSVDAARAAGLRPCRKCHPDDFARGADPVLQFIETLVGEVRRKPESFPDTQALVRRSGFGATRLFELFRQHYHTTPADLLLRARLEIARQRLLASTDSLASVAYDAGFEALSSFHENFRRLNGLTPAAFRELPRVSHFEMALPPGYPQPCLRRALGRDRHSLSERLEGDHYTAAVTYAGGPGPLALRLSETSVAAEMRVVQTHSIFDGLLWAVIGQQIGFPFACLLKRRLTERAGRLLPNGLYAPPTPDAVAELDRTDLLSLQYSRQKADYLLGIARLVAEVQLDLDRLRAGSATRVERTLLKVRGLGPWAVNYIMMRSLGFADCVPWGDTGVASGLRSLFNRKERPDPQTVRRLMKAFSPYRSLATAHLWQLNHTGST
jgi:AraC family transcriptional regulator, regulatory protein of adaptative response / DNA-3-methyladenine glycosylase II